MVKDNIGVLILFFLASLAAYIVGACLCGVGLLVAIPIVVHRPGLHLPDAQPRPGHRLTVLRTTHPRARPAARIRAAGRSSSAG